MKLIDLLNYIPDDCEIGLVRFNGRFPISHGNKSEATESLAYKYRLVKEQVENMDVRSIYSGACFQGNNVELFERDVPPFDVKPEVVIEIE